LAPTFGGDASGEPYGTRSSSQRLASIGSHSIEELLSFHERELEDEYIALWDNRGIDCEYGGLMRGWDGDGRFTTDVKQLYDLGRGLWVFAHLYNHFGRRERHLTAARLCWEFIRDYCRDEETGGWYSKVSRDGGTVVEGAYDIYGDMYVALGLSEYYRVVDDPLLLDVAAETVDGVTRRIVSSEYRHDKAHKEGLEPGTKVLGTWQHFLNALTTLAREKRDSNVEQAARMCLGNIMERHWNSEHGVFMEYLDDGFRPFPSGCDKELRKVSSWHAVQSAWMCMDEALRVGDRRVFSDAVERGRLTLEKCWWEGGDGGLIGLDYPGQPLEQSSDSPAWGRLDDVLVFLLLAIEHTQADWAVWWYDTVFGHAYEKPEQFNRSGLLHYPRRLFFSIHVFRRIIERRGKKSSFLES